MKTPNGGKKDLRPRGRKKIALGVKTVRRKKRRPRKGGEKGACANRSVNQQEQNRSIRAGRRANRKGTGSGNVTEKKNDRVSSMEKAQKDQERTPERWGEAIRGQGGGPDKKKGTIGQPKGD